MARLLAALLAIALIVAGVVLVAEVVWAWLGLDRPILPEDLTERLSTTGWDDRSVRTTLVVMGVVGLLALVLGLLRRAPSTVRVEGDADVRIERTALERSVRRRLEALDGATSARVRADGGRLTARVDSARRLPPADLRERVQQVVADEVRTHRLAVSTSVSVRSRGGEL